MKDDVAPLPVSLVQVSPPIPPPPSLCLDCVSNNVDIIPLTIFYIQVPQTTTASTLIPQTAGASGSFPIVNTQVCS
jgi:hypothetical protein